jgi:hypothetical protein
VPAPSPVPPRTDADFGVPTADSVHYVRNCGTFVGSCLRIAPSISRPVARSAQTASRETRDCFMSRNIGLNREFQERNGLQVDRIVFDFRG